MAPVAVAVAPAAHIFDKPVQATVFTAPTPTPTPTPVASSSSSSRPHGALTSGQLEPDHTQLIPYESFPKEITGPTVWTKEEYYGDESKWKWQWNAEQIQLLEQAYTAFEQKNLSLTEVNQDNFPLPPAITTFLLEIREFIVNGPGFVLIQGLPVDQWSVVKSSAIYLAIGSIVGVPISQNAKGHILGHVKDLGNDPTQIHKVRIYTTTARQFFHTDCADVVGLLCLHKAKEGGESDVVSAHAVWNTLQRERPDIAKLLAEPNWYFDRKGEVSDGQKPWIQKAIFYYTDGKVNSHYDPYYIRSIGRFVESGQIPGHTPEQLEAIQVLEETAQRLALHMVLAVGDIQFAGETHVFHARTAYVDHLPPLPRRHLLRLWLATPESEGGWKRPYPDSAAPKRGGIQVNGQRETCPLDAE